MKKMLAALITVLLFTGISYSQNQIPLIGSKAPKFKANSTNGTLTFPNDFGKNWKILFSHPSDFTPVCTTELLQLASMQSEFESHGVKIAVISTDDINQHNNWKNHLEKIDYKNQGTHKIEFPIIDDSDKQISLKYGMLHSPVSTAKDIRGVFVIDSDNTVRSVNFYPTEIGRNMDEIIRIVEALKTTEEAHILTPVNWTKGDDVIISYRPFSLEDYKSNPKIYDDKYYSLNEVVWFRKTNPVADR